ncbi:hypothetical protein PSAB6_50073 [Paraburkholderia sabiae]|nr:hypothetical protein PSAB6_50073 [Paraburkholderia sabiae]
MIEYRIRPPACAGTDDTLSLGAKPGMCGLALAFVEHQVKMRRKAALRKNWAKGHKGPVHHRPARIVSEASFRNWRADEYEVLDVLGPAARDRREAALTVRQARPPEACMDRMSG